MFSNLGWAGALLWAIAFYLVLFGLILWAEARRKARRSAWTRKRAGASWMNTDFRDSLARWRGNNGDDHVRVLRTSRKWSSLS